MDEQREDDTGTTRTEQVSSATDADGTQVVPAAPPEEGSASGGPGGDATRQVPTPREAPDDATTTVAAPGGPRYDPHGPGGQGWGPQGWSPQGYAAPQHGGPQHGGPQHGGPQGYAAAGGWGSSGPQSAGPQSAGPQGSGPQAPWPGPQQQGGPWGPPGGAGPHGAGPPLWGPPRGGEPTGAPPARRRRRGLLLGAVALVVVVALVVATVVLVDGALTRRSADRAAADVASWAGVTYRGQVDDGLGGPATVEMTVDAQGDAAGTVTRAAGGRAEFVLTRTNQAVRADEAWWARSAPRPRLATKLGGLWLSGASDQLAAVAPWALSPGDLSRAVTGRPWSDAETRPVGGVDADVLADQDDRVTVDDTGDVPRLAEVELAAFGRQRTSPVTTQRADPQALQDVAARTGGVPAMTAFRTAVAAPPLAFSRIDPIPDCFTPRCPVTVRVVNLGQYRTTGTLTVLSNDVPAGTFPFDAAPGATLPFTADLQNQAFATNTAQVTTRVTARLSDVE